MRYALALLVALLLAACGGGGGGSASTEPTDFDLDVVGTASVRLGGEIAAGSAPGDLERATRNLIDAVEESGSEWATHQLVSARDDLIGLCDRCVDLLDEALEE